MKDVITNSLAALEQWLTLHGPMGFDPYDYKSHSVYVKMTDLAERTAVAKVGLRLVEAFADHWPGPIRRLLKVKPSILPKTQALLAKGHLHLYRSTGDAEHLTKACEGLQWLQEHSVMPPDYLGWGLPFDWRSRVLIPEGTMASTVTVECGHAFWLTYEMTGEQNYRTHCKLIAAGLFDHLKHQVTGKGTLCFSYTPVDNFHVHNANLMVAEYLIRLGREFGRADWVRAGTSAVGYTINDQFQDGSFEYWGPPDRSFSHVDHYHTGFVIRSLVSLAKLGISEAEIALEKCAGHYLRSFFGPAGEPKMFPRATYPINIHSCAESVLTCVTLSQFGNEAAQERLRITLPWIVSHMQADDGHFFYKIDSHWGMPYQAYPFAFTRWGQAWMWYALCVAAGAGL